MTARAFETVGHDLTLHEAGRAWRELLWVDVAPLWIASLALAGLALATQTLVSGLGFATANLAPNFARLNPAGRLKELPANGLRQAALSLLLLGLVLGLAYSMLGSSARQYMALGRTGLAPAFVQMTTSLGGILEKAAAIFLLLGVVDYARLVPALQQRAVDDEAGGAGRTQGVRGQPAGQAARAAAAAAVFAAADDGRSGEGDGGDCEPDALCGGDPV